MDIRQEVIEKFNQLSTMHQYDVLFLVDNLCSQEHPADGMMITCRTVPITCQLLESPTDSQG